MNKPHVYHQNAHYHTITFSTLIDSYLLLFTLIFSTFIIVLTSISQREQDELRLFAINYTFVD